MISRRSVAAALLVGRLGSRAQTRTDPREIPIPPIRTSMGSMPGADDLPVRPEMPDILTMNDGSRVRTAAQWKSRREEMKRILAYYAVGRMPPPPRNVHAEQISSETVLSGKAEYRLVRLRFGPDRKLELHAGVFTPSGNGPFPAVVLMSTTPPGAPELPRLPQGPNQGKGENVLLMVGPGDKPAPPRPPFPGGARDAGETRNAVCRGASARIRAGGIQPERLRGGHYAPQNGR